MHAPLRIDPLGGRASVQHLPLTLGPNAVSLNGFGHGGQPKRHPEIWRIAMASVGVKERLAVGLQAGAVGAEDRDIVQEVAIALGIGGDQWEVPFRAERRRDGGDAGNCGEEPGKLFPQRDGCL